jgi:cyclophilin family peptidyl-prolyl cis-trans isomerase
LFLSGNGTRRFVAETVGFEPTIESPLYTLSRRAPSTTRPRLRIPFGQGTPLAARLRFRKGEGFAITWPMKKLTLLACAALLATPPLSAQEARKPFPAPGEIVAAAKAEEWVTIAPSDLLVMDFAPDAKAKPRRVVIQLMPAPFSQGWIGNVRKLAAAKFWDGTSVNRVQDNYVVQWGDATEKKALPEGLAVVSESEYVAKPSRRAPLSSTEGKVAAVLLKAQVGRDALVRVNDYGVAQPLIGWPIAFDGINDFWPTHCYGMVGVGRNLSPDTGTGAELYTVIGHAPRHLDRNIALVGRVIEGMEHLSSLPRGTGALGFYEKEEERVPILSARIGNDVKDVPAFEYLSTESTSFAAYADARANRRDPFFNVPAGGADICNIPVPVRRKGK